MQAPGAPAQPTQHQGAERRRPAAPAAAGMAAPNAASGGDLAMEGPCSARAATHAAAGTLGRKVAAAAQHRPAGAGGGTGSGRRPQMRRALGGRAGGRACLAVRVQPRAPSAAERPRCRLGRRGPGAAPHGTSTGWHRRHGQRQLPGGPGACEKPWPGGPKRQSGAVRSGGTHLAVAVEGSRCRWRSRWRWPVLEGRMAAGAAGGRAKAPRNEGTGSQKPSRALS